MRNAMLNVRDVWSQGYRRLLDQAQLHGALPARGAGAERRADPRFPIASPLVTVPGEGGATIQDMSVSGVAFRAERRSEAGRRLSCSLAKVFSAEAEVVGCEPLGGSDAGSRGGYRVRCRFRNPQHGLQFLMLALELGPLQPA
jgi:PilZ domain